MIFLVLLLILNILICYYLYTYKKIHSYFDRRGLKYRPGLPVFGNVFNSTFFRKHTIEDIDAVYNAFPGERYVGYIEGIKPIVLVRDPELIKLIAVKDFAYFSLRKPFLPGEIVPGLRKSAAMGKVANWRENRHKLGSSFTGAKIRHLMPLLKEVTENILKYLEGHQSEDLDVMDLMRRYANDVNVSTLLGMNINSVEDRDNIFIKTSQCNMNFTYKKRIICFLSSQFPTVAKLMQFLNIAVLPVSTCEIFRETVARNMRNREESCETRPDYIHMLSKNSQEWTSDAIAGLAYLAFLGGFDPSVSSLTMCIHELAINPEVQEKLYEEIRNSQDEIGEITYDDVNTLKYLDCVVNETFRKWSGAIIYRICSKSYVLPPPREGGKPYQVNPGDVIYCVANQLHRDPQYHPDPEIFNPDRFLEENKHNIKPYTFMPFGTGPRNCTGMRFSMFNIKCILYYLVLKFKIVRSAKTASPMRLMADMFYVKSIGGTWVQFVSRN